mgnify:CR=1 FL=1
MQIIRYSLLGIGAALSCMLALRWQGVGLRRSSAVSAVAGILAGLAFCLHMDMAGSTLACLLFLAVYLSVVLVQPGGSPTDAVAAVSIACAGFGMVQLTGAVILSAEVISLFFRLVLLALFLFASGFICFVMSPSFPGADWQACFGEEESADGGLGRPLAGFCCSLIVYGVSCAGVSIAGTASFSVMLLEWFGFFGGLGLFNILISNRKERQNVLTEKQYRDDMQTYMSVIRSQRHDYNFHVQTMHGLLLRKDYAACETYLEELMKDTIAMNQLLPVSDAAISALILSFQSRAAQSGIPMEIHIENDLSRIATNVYETNKILGNLLQNALDETERLSDRSYGIHLTVIKRGEFCLISVSNRAASTQPMNGYQVGKSRKAGHEGIGIASIQALAARYGGVVYSRVEQDIIYFVAKIPLRLVKEDKEW